MTPGRLSIQAHNCIVLSYAPSAAAVWQCDRVRAMCESNSVRHKVLFKALCLAPLGASSGNPIIIS